MTEDEERIAAIETLANTARTIRDGLQHMELCPVHGPVALLGAAYIAAGREAGMSDIESLARLKWMASQSARFDPGNRVN